MNLDLFELSNQTFNDSIKVNSILQNSYQKSGQPPLAVVRTFGCQQNISDSEKIKGMLCTMGYSLTEEVESASLIIFNTCAVREHAEDKIFGNVGALQHLKKRNPDLIVALCGCMMQQEHIATKIKKSFPHVDLVFGTHALSSMPSLVLKVLTSGGRVFDIGEEQDNPDREIPIKRDGKIKAWIPIMYGCDNFCSFCVVPYVRGRERSRNPETIVGEIKALVEEGFKEFTLLGQNVNSYGKNLENPTSFSTLLRKINAISGDFRIKFMTSHPKDCTKELIDTIAQCDKVCNYIHLPVQSGSNRILSEMNRHYTKEQYLELVDYAMQKIPGVAFTSDIIVGFPSETEEDFEETLDLVKKVRFQSLFTFIFSKRQLTKAYDMPDITDPQEKSNRFNQLVNIQNEIGNEHHLAQVGKTLKVLADGYSKGGNQLTGRSESNIIVNFEAPAEYIGRFVEVKITKALKWAIEGVLEQ